MTRPDPDDGPKTLAVLTALFIVGAAFWAGVTIIAIEWMTK
jgi:hypothetical protein